MTLLLDLVRHYGGSCLSYVLVIGVRYSHEVLSLASNNINERWLLLSPVIDLAATSFSVLGNFAPAAVYLSSKLWHVWLLEQELCDRTEALIRNDPQKYIMRNLQVAVLLRRVKPRRSSDLAR